MFDTALRIYRTRAALDYRGTDLPDEFAVMDADGKTLKRSEDVEEVRTFAHEKGKADRALVIDLTLPPTQTPSTDYTFVRD